MSEVTADKKIDIRGLVCPYTFVRSKLAVEELETGQVLEILLDYEDASVNIPRSMKDHGQTVLKVDKINDKEWVILVRKDKD